MEPAPRSGPRRKREVVVDVDLTAWAEDCVVRGRTVLQEADRLSDRINTDGRVDLTDATVDTLDDVARRFGLDSLSLGLDELCAIELFGGRGDPARRRVMVRHRVALEIGPYEIEATLHAGPGTRPLATFRHRPALVPLTDAEVRIGREGDQRCWRVGSLGVVQSRIRSIREIAADPADETTAATDR